MFSSSEKWCISELPFNIRELKIIILMKKNLKGNKHRTVLCIEILKAPCSEESEDISNVVVNLVMFGNNNV